MQHRVLTSSVDVADCLLKVSVLLALAGLGCYQFGFTNHKQNNHTFSVCSTAVPLMFTSYLIHQIPQGLTGSVR